MDKDNVSGVLQEVGKLAAPMLKQALPRLLQGYLQDLQESEESVEGLKEVVMAIFDNLVPRSIAVKAVKQGKTLKEYIDTHWQEDRDRARRTIYAFVGVAQKILREYDQPDVETAIEQSRSYFKKTDLGILLDYHAGRQWYRAQIRELIKWIWPRDGGGNGVPEQ